MDLCVCVPGGLQWRAGRGPGLRMGFKYVYDPVTEAPNFPRETWKVKEHQENIMHCRSFSCKMLLHQNKLMTT